jgi:hypothetical protein
MALLDGGEEPVERAFLRGREVLGEVPIKWIARFPGGMLGMIGDVQGT